MLASTSLYQEITDKHIQSYMKQLCNGIFYLHSKKILHRDLKTANILITQNNVVKIADWNLARTCYGSKQQKLSEQTVTLWYRPPEICLGHRYYGFEVDMWSLGLVIGAS